jgi:hypothetical protein
MTTFSPDFSPRYKVDYVAAGFVHSAQFRIARGNTWNLLNLLNVVGAIQAFYDALQPLLPEDFAINSCSIAEQDTNVFNPTDQIPVVVAGAKPLADYSPYARATATTFTGRDAPSPVHVEQYGPLWLVSTPTGIAGNGKVNATESTPISQAISALSGGPFSSTSGNGGTIWKSYATVKVNDYWLKRVRKTFP